MMRWSAPEDDMPDNAVVSLFGTVYIGFALATSIAVNRDITPPYYACGMRLPDGRGVWVAGLTYNDEDVAYFWDWRAARDFIDEKNKEFPHVR